MNARIEKLRRTLEAKLLPLELKIDDDSALHAGHAGAASGGGHFRVYIVSEKFAGQRPIARHRMVYEALGELMHVDIHALSITARAPGEAASAS